MTITGTTTFNNFIDTVASTTVFDGVIITREFIACIPSDTFCWSVITIQSEWLQSFILGFYPYHWLVIGAIILSVMYGFYKLIRELTR